VTEALRRLHIRAVPVKDKGRKAVHAGLSVIQKLKRKYPRKFNKAKVFAFVRHPASWYRSRFWQNRYLHWHRRIRSEGLCRRRSFASYLECSLERRPGYYTRMCQRYTGTEEQPIEFIGRTENLAEDLAAILGMLGAKPNGKVLRRMSRLNRGKYDRGIVEGHLRRIQEAELLVYRRFGYSLNHRDPPVYSITPAYSKPVNSVPCEDQLNVRR
jgi:hypothetical protein